jgi:hypothetical protein
MAEPLLRHEGGAAPAAAVDVLPPDRDAIQRDGLRVRREPLARQRGEELVLAVPRDAGDAEDLAAMQGERDLVAARAAG